MQLINILGQYFPRRNCVDRLTTAESAILYAQRAVEDAGANQLLTNAVQLLEQARNLVADYVESSNNNNES